MTISNPNPNVNIPMVSVGTLAAEAEPTFVFRLLGSIYKKEAGEDEAHPTVLTVEVSAKDEKAAEVKIAAGFTELVEAIAIINHQKELQRLAEERMKQHDEVYKPYGAQDPGIAYKNPQDIKQWTSDTIDLNKKNPMFDMNDFTIKLGQSEIKGLEVGGGEAFDLGGMKVRFDDGDDNS